MENTVVNWKMNGQVCSQKLSKQHAHHRCGDEHRQRQAYSGSVSLAAADQAQH